jgi:hypothetical protein
MGVKDREKRTQENLYHWYLDAAPASISLLCDVACKLLLCVIKFMMYTSSHHIFKAIR